MASSMSGVLVLSFVARSGQRWTLLQYAEKISPHLYCPICTEVFEQPQHLPCAHVFCSTCILQWLESKRECPQCRKAVQVHDLHKDLIVSHMVDDLLVRCPFTAPKPSDPTSLGCRWLGKRKNLTAHTRDCEMDPKKVPEWLRGGDISLERLSAKQQTLQDKLKSLRPKRKVMDFSIDSDSDPESGNNSDAENSAAADNRVAAASATSPNRRWADVDVARASSSSGDRDAAVFSASDDDDDEHGAVAREHPSAT